MPDSLSKKLKKWRGKLYQKEAAEKLGISVWTYRNYELNRRVPWSIARRMILQILDEEQKPKSKRGEIT